MHLKLIPSPTKERLASQVIKKKITDGATSELVHSKQQQQTIYLKSGGSPMPVSVQPRTGDGVKKKLEFGHKDMFRLQQKAHLSDAQVKKVAKAFRVVGGREIVSTTPSTSLN